MTRPEELISRKFCPPVLAVFVAVEVVVVEVVEPQAVTGAAVSAEGALLVPAGRHIGAAIITASWVD